MSLRNNIKIKKQINTNLIKDKEDIEKLRQYINTFSSNIYFVEFKYVEKLFTELTIDKRKIIEFLPNMIIFL
jgi:hypothetical protein